MINDAQAFGLIVATVADVYRVPPALLIGKRRTRTVALARQVAYWCVREHLAWSYPRIGAVFGGRDHSTIIHGVQRVDNARRFVGGVSLGLGEVRRAVEAARAHSVCPGCGRAEVAA